MENKYLLKQNEEDEGVLCRIITIDGFDYYVSDKPRGSNYIIWLEGTPKLTYATLITSTLYSGGHAENWKRVIATNNPDIHIPKVVDEVNRLANQYSNQAKIPSCEYDCSTIEDAVKYGYNKRKETHPNSDEDMKSFLKFSIEYRLYNGLEGLSKTPDELLQLWKDQQPKIVYYE